MTAKREVIRKLLCSPKAATMACEIAVCQRGLHRVEIEPYACAIGRFSMKFDVGHALGFDRLDH